VLRCCLSLCMLSIIYNASECCCSRCRTAAATAAAAAGDRAAADAAVCCNRYLLLPPTRVYRSGAFVLRSPFLDCAAAPLWLCFFTAVDCGIIIIIYKLHASRDSCCICLLLLKQHCILSANEGFCVSDCLFLLRA
jgi:hypothetical protein